MEIYTQLTGNSRNTVNMVRKMVNRRTSDIISKIKSGRYVYKFSDDSLFDTKLNEDVSDLLNGVDRSEVIEAAYGSDTKTSKNPEPVEQPADDVKEEKTSEIKDDERFSFSEFRDRHFMFLSMDNTMMISLEHAPMNNLKGFKISKDFSDESMEKMSSSLPRLSYENHSDVPTSSFLGEKILNIMQFFKEVTTKIKYCHLDDIKFYVAHNYPMSMIAEYFDDESSHIKWRILVILANMVGD